MIRGLVDKEWGEWVHRSLPETGYVFNVWSTTQKHSANRLRELRKIENLTLMTLETRALGLCFPNSWRLIT